MQQVSIGEQLVAQGSAIPVISWIHWLTLCSAGPDFHLPAALSFFRALRVYPSPVELIMIYQKTVPEPVFKVRQSPIYSLVHIPLTTLSSVNYGTYKSERE